MSAPRRPTLIAASGGRPSGRPLSERLLGSFMQVEAGEARSLVLFFSHAFLVLVSLYIVRTLREPLLLVDASAEVKTYASAAAALALLVLVPLYGAAFRRTNRSQLVRGVTGFFIATLGALFLRRRLFPRLVPAPAPRQPHPRVTDDRFALLVLERDASFAPDRFRRLCEALRPVEVVEDWRTA